MINLYLHGGSQNHGCEAIVRTTVAMLDQRVTLFSSNPEQDYGYGIDKLCDIVRDSDQKIISKSKEWYLSRFQTKFFHKIDLEIKYRRNELLKRVRKNDIYLSIGGDNYCYKGTDILSALNTNLKKKGARLVLWGCSVEPDLVDQKELTQDLRKFDLITARETISYNALKKINNNTVLVADPAFTLKREDLPLPIGFQENNMIGVNISPLVLSIADSEKVLRAFDSLIQYILKNTSYGVALIPHVVWKSNDDRQPLEILYKHYKDSKRVIIINDCTCSQLKGYIARCKLFIGARTHATIAAYSTFIPTLVIGYSVKATGIARDIFGTEKNYVLPVREILNERVLIDRFCWILDNADEIKHHLHSVMPQYVNRAFVAKKYLDELK